MNLKNIPENNISRVINNIVGDSLMQAKEKSLEYQIKQEQRFELECLECGVLYYGNKEFDKCQYCYSGMKSYKFQNWQREVMNKFLKIYQGNYIWLRR
jgi:rRNA maturation endonuclease Nob1